MMTRHCRRILHRQRSHCPEGTRCRDAALVCPAGPDLYRVVTVTRCPACHQTNDASWLVVGTLLHLGAI